MKRFINILTALCSITFISGCTEIDIDDLQITEPYIESIEAEICDFNSSRVTVRLDMSIYPYMPNSEDCIVVASTSKNTYNYEVYDGGSSDYVFFDLYRSDFSTDTTKKTKYVDLTVSIQDKDRRVLDKQIVTVSYSYDTKIKILSVKGGEREYYGEDGYAYQTPYTIEYEIINAEGLTDCYLYYEGSSWTYPGRGDDVSYDVGGKGTYKSNIFYDNGDYAAAALYIQLRGLLIDGSEIVSDKSVKIEIINGYASFSLVYLM